MNLIQLLILHSIVIMGIAFTFIKPRVVLFFFLFFLMAFNDYVGGLPSSIIEIGGRSFYAADFFIVLLIIGIFRGLLEKEIGTKLDRPVLIIMVILTAYSIIGMLIGGSRNFLRNDIIGDFHRYYYYPWAIFIPIILLRYRMDINAIEKVAFAAAPIICIFALYRIITGQTYLPKVHAFEFDSFRAMGFHDIAFLFSSSVFQ